MNQINITGFVGPAAEVTAKQLMQRSIVKRRKMSCFMMERYDAKQQNLKAHETNLVRSN